MNKILVLHCFKTEEIQGVGKPLFYRQLKSAFLYLTVLYNIVLYNIGLCYICKRDLKNIGGLKNLKNHHYGNTHSVRCH